VCLFMTTDVVLVLHTDISTTQEQILAFTETKAWVALGFVTHGGPYAVRQFP
jgi:hypothetical protein